MKLSFLMLFLPFVCFTQNVEDVEPDKHYSFTADGIEWYFIDHHKVCVPENADGFCFATPVYKKERGKSLEFCFFIYGCQEKVKDHAYKYVFTSSRQFKRFVDFKYGEEYWAIPRGDCMSLGKVFQPSGLLSEYEIGQMLRRQYWADVMKLRYKVDMCENPSAYKSFMKDIIDLGLF